ncbi:hypothetical protein I7I50_10387 [Histoplasma capsulatum G186AR]|uniref:Uncharacterized protein n=1 Tax=Ajellomyces capsulatus TaxID=5037 RepID=A0A8H8D6D8_AJECA|nr:hypothetical protein I7I52_01626 [Histoplasma capsulatum]QSS69187.1 hypothetical protein I7I50_10387 [Histoplasma capsulatum G186AR]
MICWRERGSDRWMEYLRRKPQPQALVQILLRSKTPHQRWCCYITSRMVVLVVLAINRISCSRY